MFTSLLLTVKHKLVFDLDNTHLDCQKKSWAEEELIKDNRKRRLTSVYFHLRY